MSIGLLLVVVWLVLAAICLIASILALFSLRPIIALFLFLAFLTLLAFAVGTGILWILWRILLRVN